MTKMEELRKSAIEYLEVDKIIRNPEIAEFTKMGLLYAKEDFFIIPASSSGKYHPSYALGVGGLLRHTKAALVLAQALFPTYNFNEVQRDFILSALVLHDIEKPSKNHPVEVKLRLEPLREQYPEEFETIIPLIESHMGQWDNYGKLPQPGKNKLKRFVHLCDYLASRKELTVELETSRM